MDDTELHSAVAEFPARSPSVGGCVAYRIDDDGSRAVAAAGMADPREGRPMTVDATFRIASCTKTFSAATVLRLAEEGQLKLTDRAATFIEPERADKLDLGEISLHHLLQHTSGLPDMDGQAFRDELYRSPNKVWTPWEKIERSVIGREGTGRPGPPARYCDVGYVLLAMIIESVTDAPLHCAFRRLLSLEALGLEVIHVEWLESTPSGAGPRVRHFVDDRDVTEIHPSCDLWGAGGLVSNARDLAEWWHALFGGRVLHDAASLSAMLSTIPEPAAARDMGFGIYRRMVQSQAIWAHGGWWGAYALHNQTTGTTAAVLLTQCLDYTGPAFRNFTLGLVMD